MGLGKEEETRLGLLPGCPQSAQTLLPGFLAISKRRFLRYSLPWGEFSSSGTSLAPPLTLKAGGQHVPISVEAGIDQRGIPWHLGKHSGNTALAAPEGVLQLGFHELGVEILDSTNPFMLRLLRLGQEHKVAVGCQHLEGIIEFLSASFLEGQLVRHGKQDLN